MLRTRCQIPDHSEPSKLNRKKHRAACLKPELHFAAASRMQTGGLSCWAPPSAQIIRASILLCGNSCWPRRSVPEPSENPVQKDVTFRLRVNIARESARPVPALTDVVPGSKADLCPPSPESTSRPPPSWRATTRAIQDVRPPIAPVLAAYSRLCRHKTRYAATCCNRRSGPCFHRNRRPSRPPPCEPLR